MTENGRSMSLAQGFKRDPSGATLPFDEALNVPETRCQQYCNRAFDGRMFATVAGAIGTYTKQSAGWPTR